MAVKNAAVLQAAMPIRCSACYGQYPERTYWDYEALCDRGFAPESQDEFNANGERTIKAVSMDFLILCDECVKEGARAIGWVAQDDDAIARLTEELDIERKARKQAQNYADRLEGAFEARAEPIVLDHRQKPRKELVNA